MDAALCGGGVPNQSYTNTVIPLSSSAVNMIKAAIFMGDPLFKAGLSYDVGTCAAGGVSLLSRTSTFLKTGADG
jgi:acetylxylan esterase